MTNEEFSIVDKVRKQDMEFLINRFNRLMESPGMTLQMAMGISLCYGIVKAYQDSIGKKDND